MIEYRILQLDKIKSRKEKLPEFVVCLFVLLFSFFFFVVVVVVVVVLFFLEYFIFDVNIINFERSFL